jgi:hypothetical protein
MKPKIVRVIANNPNPDQVDIYPLLNRKYKVKDYDKKTGEVYVISRLFQGRIALNRSEYERVS